jgi:hypothetical protein
VVSSSPACEGDITYTWTYTDCAGNTQDYVHTVTITYLPFAAIAPTTATVACEADIVMPTLPTVLDNCGNTLTPTGPVVSSSPACEGDITYTWTYTDCAGNTQDYVHTVTITLSAFIIADAPGASTVNCVADAVEPTTGLPLVTDACGNTLIATGSPQVIDNPSPLTCGGTRTFRYTYTDCANNTATWDYVYTIDDKIPPAFAVPPADITVECISDVPAMTSLDYTDNCDAAGSVTGTDSAPSGTCPATITRTWTFTDACGNSATASQIITILDQTAPVFAAAPADITVDCIADVPAMTSLDYTDNCDAAGSVTGTDSAPSGTCPATFTRTWTFTDACGNNATATQIITILDQTAPVFAAAPADITVDCIGNVTAMTSDDKK